MDVLQRVAEHLKPGGWLLLEDPDDDCFWDDGGPPGPNIQALLGAWHRSMRERGSEPCIGRMLEAELRSLGTFAEVNSHYIDIPLSGQSSGMLFWWRFPGQTDVSHEVLIENQLGEGWQRTMQGVISIIRDGLVTYGVTSENMDGALTELKDPTKKLTTRMYFTWSKKF